MAIKAKPKDRVAGPRAKTVISIPKENNPVYGDDLPMPWREAPPAKRGSRQIPFGYYSKAARSKSSQSASEQWFALRQFAPTWHVCGFLPSEDVTKNHHYSQTNGDFPIYPVMNCDAPTREQGLLRFGLSGFEDGGGHQTPFTLPAKTTEIILPEVSRNVEPQERPGIFRRFVLTFRDQKS